MVRKEVRTCTSTSVGLYPNPSLFIFQVCFSFAKCVYFPAKCVYYPTSVFIFMKVCCDFQIVQSVSIISYGLLKIASSVSWFSFHFLSKIFWVL